MRALAGYALFEISSLDSAYSVHLSALETSSCRNGFLSTVDDGGRRTGCTPIVTCLLSTTPEAAVYGADVSF
jgi:hypothetical protein